MTGASGFIGQHLLNRLHELSWKTVTVAHHQQSDPPLNHHSSVTDWAQGLEGIDLVVHLAGVAHRRAPLDELLAVNERWPVTLFEAASAAGVADFVWLSSIKVLGDTSEQPLRATDAYRPADEYAESKMRSEIKLLDIAPASKTVLSIIRPPLVYGPGVKANFAALIRLAQRCGRGLPLPLGAATAMRSLIGVANLCDLMVTVPGHSGIFHGADAEDISVVKLLEALGARHARLLPLPASLLRGLAALTGQRGLYGKLFQPLQIDQRATLSALHWQPPLTMAEQIEETVAWYRQKQ